MHRASSAKLLTLANKITVTRICLIPVFLWSAWSYDASVHRSAPSEGLRIFATVVFLLAALTDGIDGFVARRWNQRSRLGSVLDPVADKGLIFGALIVLSSRGWDPSLPWYFPCIVIGRDLLLGVGFLILSKLIGQAEVHPSWIGKLATALQIVCVLWVLLRLRVGLLWLVILASLLTILSGLGYVVDGIARIARKS
jgi:cardiolipin synthase (CMP-forming)